MGSVEFVTNCDKLSKSAKINVTLYVNDLLQDWCQRTASALEYFLGGSRSLVGDDE